MIALGAATALAQTPSPVREWPYRMVVSGPATAPAGSEVTYRVEYTRVVADAPETPHFIFVWPREGVEFVSLMAVAGPAGQSQPQTDVSVRWGAERADFGAVDVVLRIDPEFSGELRAAIYLAGTSLSYPPGSITFVTTQVGAAGSPTMAVPALPNTGVSPGDGAPWGAPWLLAAFGLSAIALAAAMRLRMR